MSGILVDIAKRTFYRATVRDSVWLRCVAHDAGIPDVFGDIKYSSNVRRRVKCKVGESRLEDAAVEHILDTGKYSFSSPLFIKNPYRMSLLSGLLVFNTEVECKTEYTIKGMRESEDFTKCDEIYTKRHRVPILGFYEDAMNTLCVRLIDRDGNELKRRVLKIKMQKVTGKDDNSDKVRLTFSEAPSKAGFIMCSGGYHGGVYAFDKFGNIRFAMPEKPQYYGVHYFSETGRFLFPEMNMRRPGYGNAHTVVMHEMDMMGRTHHTYYHKKGFHHWAAEMGAGGNILALTSSMTDTYMENAITEIDRNTGEPVLEISMNDLFDDTYKTRNDWAHVNAVDYIPEENCIVVSLRNVHTIAKISLDTKKLVWLLTNPEFYKGTAQEDLVLKPVGDIKWFFQQHGAQILHAPGDREKGLLHIMVFDNHTVNRRPVDYYDKDKSSNGMVFEIDEKNRTFKQLKVFNTPLSVTRSNMEYEYGRGRVLVNCANFKPEVDGYKGRVYEIDYKTGKHLNEFSCVTDFFAAHMVDFNLKDMSEPINLSSKPFRGSLTEPSESAERPEGLEEAPKIADTEVGTEVFRFQLFGDILEIKCTDHDLYHAYLYNEEHMYEMDYTDTKQPLSLFKKQSYYHMFPLHSLPLGVYQLAVDFKGTVYNTRYYVNKHDINDDSEINAGQDA